jgi:hypothetical protein
VGSALKWAYADAEVIAVGFHVLRRCQFVSALFLMEVADRNAFNATVAGHEWISGRTVSGIQAGEGWQ